MSQVNVELFRSSTAQISLNESDVRTLAGVPSGTISMDNLRGKSNVFAFAIASNQIDANLRTLAINAGWDGTIPVQATINSGVFISGSVPGNSTPALTINGSFPNGVSLINNGTIAGDGGDGGAGGAAAIGTASGSANTTVGAAGSTGGLALSVSVPVSITNNGTIAGGGGGGGGGGGSSIYWQYGSSSSDAYLWQSGGGGGGGRANASYSSSGGAAGVLTGTGQSSTSSQVQIATVAAGGSGTSSAAGAGGAGGSRSGVGGTLHSVTAGTGGAGGDWGAAGATGGTGTFSGSLVIRSYLRAGGAGGGAGNAVSGNSNITWVAFGTRLGAIA